MNINISIFRVINNLGKDFLWLNPVVILLAKYMVFFLLITLLWYWFSRNRAKRTMVISATISFVFAFLLARFAGQFHQNIQPFAALENVNQLLQHEIDNSFPSDHTSFFFSICATFWFFRLRFRWGWMILALCVGLSRIMVGVHYPFDVATGAVIGIFSAFISYKLFNNNRLIHNSIDFYEKTEKRIWKKKSKNKL